MFGWQGGENVNLNLNVNENCSGSGSGSGSRGARNGKICFQMFSNIFNQQINKTDLFSHQNQKRIKTYKNIEEFQHLS